MSSARCPICSKALAADRGETPTYPFCSPRCKLVDLGNWLDGRYRVPGEPVDPEADPGGHEPLPS